MHAARSESTRERAAIHLVVIWMSANRQCPLCEQSVVGAELTINPQVAPIGHLALALCEFRFAEFADICAMCLFEFKTPASAGSRHGLCSAEARF